MVILNKLVVVVDWLKGSSVNYNRKRADASRDRKGESIMASITEEKWNAAFKLLKSQFEVEDVLPDQQKAIKSFFEGKRMRSTLSCNNTVSRSRRLRTTARNLAR